MALKHIELENPNSCLSRAADDEPIFVLRANDENAPGVVIAWMKDYIISKGGWERMDTAQRSKAAEAGKFAADMRMWKMRQTVAK